MNYERKIEFAIKLLQSIPQDGPIELSYSGGKDSDVILELAKMSGIPFEAIYKQTTIDPPGTTKHAKEAGATIIRPEKTFLQLVSENGLPTRFRRFCCEKMKEYSMSKRTRRSMSKVASKSSSVSPGKPTIISDVIAISGILLRIYSTME